MMYDSDCPYAASKTDAGKDHIQSARMNITLKRFLLVTLLAFVAGRSLLAQPNVEVFVDIPDPQLRSAMQRDASAFLSDINTAYARKRELSFGRYLSNQTVRSALLSEWAQERFRIPEAKIVETALKKTDATYIIRNIPVLRDRPDGTEVYEEAVLQFDHEGRIQDFYFGLPAHRYQEKLRQGKDDIDIANREIILTFLDGMTNAYRRKDIGNFSNLYTDHTIFVIGRRIEDSGERSPYASRVEYLTYEREEFMKRLAEIFQNNGWIEVEFSTISILRHPRYPEMYGVTLTQNYSSSTYQDSGYLFLLVDFRDRNRPIIHVRIWQDVKSTPDDNRFQLGEVEI
jgi:hypothetical protein